MKGNLLQGHLAMRGRAYTGDGWRALRCSAKTSIATDMDPDQLYELVSAGLRGLVASLPASVRGEAEHLDVVRVTMQRLGPSLGGFNARRAPCVDEPTRRDVQAVKTHFEGQVITEIDKARGELAVL